jgi:hypothetical protein
MHNQTLRAASLGAGWAAVLCGLGFALGPAADAALAPYSQSSDRGSISLELHRGGFLPFEATVLPTPKQCRGHLDLELAWDQARNRVRVRLTGKQALVRKPSVDREAGVDFLPNPWFAEPEDIDGGHYQLWIVGAAGPRWEFWYDGETLELLGGGPDFEAPTGAIPRSYPTFHLITSPTFDPKPSGNVRLDWSFAYDSAHRGDQPEFAHHTLAFVAPDLCHVDPWRVDKTTLRPWVSDAYPRAEARPWSDYVRGGLLFNVVLVPDDDHGWGQQVTPPLSLVSTYSGATVLGGGVPRDWSLDLDAAFAGLAPPIQRWAGAERCQQEFAGFHTGDDVCEPE